MITIKVGILCNLRLTKFTNSVASFHSYLCMQTKYNIVITLCIFLPKIRSAFCYFCDLVYVTKKNSKFWKHLVFCVSKPSSKLLIIIYACISANKLF